MEEDLRLCAVKPAAELDRRHCFEVVSPLKSHVMQADSEPSYRLWVDAMQVPLPLSTAASRHPNGSKFLSGSFELMFKPFNLRS